MLQNIAHQRINCFIIAEDCFHAAQIMLTALNYPGICILRHDVIFLINQLQRCCIEFQLDNTALIVNRACGTILHRLCHIVNVDVVAEHLTGTAILCRDRRSCKTDICCIGQAVADNARRADNNFRNFFAGLIGCHLDLFRQTILPSVRFVCHNNNVAAVRETLEGFLEFLHGREDDAVCFSACKQRFQMLAAFCMNRILPQKIAAFCKLRIKLIVQIIAVGQYNNRR